MFRIKEILKEIGTKENGLTSISALATKAGVTQPTLSNIVNNNATPTTDTLQKIADALNVHISELFERPDDNVFRCPKCGTTLEIKEK